jgi:hypothetical protein
MSRKKSADVAPSVATIAATGRRPRGVRTDAVYFFLGAVSIIWLAYLILTQAVVSGFATLWLYAVFWVLVAYIALPRLHRVLTNIYVPNYFIGRTRTSDGLLGDPVNLAFLGTEQQMHAAMEKAGWTRADDLNLRSAGRIVASTVLRRSYARAPVSPLMLFGRNQDFAYQQEVKGNPAKRHHVRFWRCPDGWLLPGGARVDWLAAGTYDRAVGFSLFTLQITHKIAENTDIERDYIVDSVSEATAEVTVSRLTNFASSYHARNGGGDAIITDGDLPVVELGGISTELETPADVPGEDAGDADATEQTGRIRRPLPVLFGGIAVLLRGISPTLLVIAVLTDFRNARVLLEIDGTNIAASEQVLAIWLSITYALVYIVIEGILGILVLRGSNTARVLVMGFAVFNLAVAALNSILSGAEISLATNLISVSFDTLVLIALSNQAARMYARRKQLQKYLQKRQRKEVRRALRRA